MSAHLIMPPIKVTAPSGAFHEVMAPTWHTAYPAKDFDALVAAGPKFDSLFKGIADIQPTMKSAKRKAAFLTHREKFAQMVKAMLKRPRPD